MCTMYTEIPIFEPESNLTNYDHYCGWWLD